MVEIIKKYTEELKTLDITKSDACAKVSEYYGIMRVLQDIYATNEETNSAIKEFCSVYRMISNNQMASILDKMKEDVEICDKILGNTTPTPKERFEEDKLASVKGTVTQLFKDRVIPYIDDIRKDNSLSEEEKVANIKDMISMILKQSDCSEDYYNKKMYFVNKETTVEGLIDTINRSISNGKTYKHKEKEN